MEPFDPLRFPDSCGPAQKGLLLAIVQNLPIVSLMTCVASVIVVICSVIGWECEKLPSDTDPHIHMEMWDYK